MGALQDRGFKVALVTDGRMSGASGKVLAAIHVTPEAVEGGPLAKVRDGDVIRVDGENGTLDVISPADWRDRAPAQLDLGGEQSRGYGRELFTLFRANACSAEHGGTRVSGLRSALVVLLFAQPAHESFVARRGREAFADGDLELAIESAAERYGQMLDRAEHGEVAGDKRQIVRPQMHHENAPAFFRAHRIGRLPLSCAPQRRAATCAAAAAACRRGAHGANNS